MCAGAGELCGVCAGAGELCGVCAGAGELCGVCAGAGELCGVCDGAGQTRGNPVDTRIYPEATYLQDLRPEAQSRISNYLITN